MTVVLSACGCLRDTSDVVEVGFRVLGFASGFGSCSIWFRLAFWIFVNCGECAIWFANWLFRLVWVSRVLVYGFGFWVGVWGGLA